MPEATVWTTGPPLIAPLAMDGRKSCLLVLACWLLVCHFPPIIAQQGEEWMDVAEETLNRDEDSGFAIEQCEEQQELTVLSHQPQQGHTVTVGIMRICLLHSRHAPLSSTGRHMANCFPSMNWPPCPVFEKSNWRSRPSI